jgi:hypothetical protein
MIRISIIAGDATGGPHAQADLDLEREPESLRDEEVQGWVAAVRTLFREGHRREPESVIVTVTDVPREAA